MSPTEFNAALVDIGWSYGVLADQLGCHRGHVSLMGRGLTPIPDGIGEWLERLADTHRRNRVPAWRTAPNRLALETRAEIRRLYALGYPVSDLAADYSVSPATIYRIIDRHTDSSS
jgi:hypothetical protein